MRPTTAILSILAAGALLATMMAGGDRAPAGVDETLAGSCPVCGQEVLWTPTGRLWPSKRAARVVLPTHSGICGSCHRTLMFTVVSGPAED